MLSKPSLAFILAALLLSSGAAQASQAIQVDVRGGFVGFDQDAYRAVRAVIGNMLTNGTVTKFITTSVGLDGGVTFCAEVAQKPGLSSETLLKALKPIQVDPQTTFYSLSELEHCTEQAPEQPASARN